MEFFNHPKTLGIVIFLVSFTYISWKSFIKSFKSEKIFDFSFLYFLLGLLTERLLFVLNNWVNLTNLDWSLVNFSNTLPIALINFDKYSGFSIVYFFIGAFLGISIYNWINSVHKVDYISLDMLIRITIICVLPLVILSILSTLISTTDIQIAQLIPNIVRIFIVILLLALFNFFNKFWKSRSGLYSSIVVLVICISEIIINYLDPSYIPTILGILDFEQSIGIIAVVLSINLLLTSIATIQEQEIRNRLKSVKPALNKGFAISFANRRRVSNPINIKFKNLKPQKRRIRDTRKEI